jgi:penicillin G amidase
MSNSRPIRSLVIVLILALAGGVGPSARAQSETLRIPGVSEPVEIIKDRWGISHIYAKNERDLFFAQGYGVARDRLFQLELWRRQATGTVAEILGARELKRDIGTRLHMFRGDLKQELNFYHPRGEEIVNAFVAGINAYVEQAERNPKLLPVEFKLLGIKPGRWTPEVVISRHQGLVGNVIQEVNYAEAVRVLGVERVKGLSFFQGGDPVLAVDPAVDLSLINADILELYRAYRNPLRFLANDVVADRRGARATEHLARAVSREDVREDIGSNNWVLSGTRTISGKPIMANDPHRAQGAPSLRYWVHLVAPGWNVIGGGEPALPGVSIGHNEYGAWGLTIFGNDSEDLYVYETNAANPLQYKYRGSWETMRVVQETIAVKGATAVTVDLKYTRHGPVLREDTSRHKAYALRAAWMEIGSAPYLASLRMDQARAWEEFREASAYNRIPAENMVWADVHGTIGWQAAGIQPLRSNWSGLVPVPGDGRYEWDGYLPIKALPHVANPEKGFFVTANHYLFPEGYPYPAAMHFTWADPYRATRINELLGSGRLFTVAETMAVQNDDLSIPARSLVPLLADVSITNPQVQQARDLLLKWNYVLDKNSAVAGIYIGWQRRLQNNLLDLLVPKEARQAIGNLSMKKIIDWLVAPDGRFGADPVASRDRLLVRGLEEAVAELTKRLGPDMNAWHYGQPRYHHALIGHLLAEAVTSELRAKLNVGPLPRGGDSFTVTATGGGDNQTAGGSFKIIADTDDWDNSVGINNPGQSGDPDNPHYRDLFELWARGKYFPVFYSRAKVESVAESRTTLEGAAVTTVSGR